jgi:HPt (histidine-containing phosphotransfer) domain-containing protein
MGELVLDSNHPRQYRLSQLLLHLSEDKAKAHRLVEIYLTVYPVWLRALDDALAGHDRVALRRVAYAIRGGCAFFSATECVDLARQLENSPAGCLDSTLPELCGQLKCELRELGSQLSDFTVAASAGRQ